MPHCAGQSDAEELFGLPAPTPLQPQLALSLLLLSPVTNHTVLDAAAVFQSSGFLHARLAK